MKSLCHNRINVSVDGWCKMAEDTDQRVHCALEDIVNSTNQSKHVKSELKKTIMEAVSTLRDIFHVLQREIADKSETNIKLQAEVDETKKMLQDYRDTRATIPVAPSIGRRETPATNTRGLQHPSSVRKVNYSDIVAGRRDDRKFKVTIRSKENHTPETIKELIKAKINPTEMKVGISTFKALKDGRILIEAGSKEEIERISTNITEKCGREFEAKVQELRNPRLVIYNIPEDITLENATKTIHEQNSELQLEESDISAKFIYRTKRNTRNLVVEVKSNARKQILNTRLKMGWVICKADDYIHVNRCFKCSRYNHRLAECRGEETCPLCTGRHKIRECTSSQNEYKCINCMTYNKYNSRKTISTNHSSLDKNCPSLQAILLKYKRNTDY